jgi:hypothetical protein
VLLLQLPQLVKLFILELEITVIQIAINSRLDVLLMDQLVLPELVLITQVHLITQIATHG